MRIAVTYDNGKVFQHFGHTESFKVYEVENGKILSASVIGTDGQGHEALAGVLADKDIQVLICGGMGQGAKDALAEAGIEVVSGADGDADEAVEMYLAGELKSAGVNCSHHEHEHEEKEDCSCGGEEEGCIGSCGSCGGGCGGCGTPRIIMEGLNAGKQVRVHYRGTLNDGTQFDSSYDRGQTLDYICGTGMMIPGFDKAVVNMKEGEKTEVHLMPEEAYGPVHPEYIAEVLIKDCPGSEDLEIGQQVYLRNSMGQPFPVHVTAKDAEHITFDANHELAGKELNFAIELVEVK